MGDLKSSRRGGRQMALYRCYFLDDKDQIACPAEIIDVEDASEAINKVSEMLKARPHYYSAEVWDGSRRLFALRSQIQNGRKAADGSTSMSRSTTTSE